MRIIMTAVGKQPPNNPYPRPQGHAMVLDKPCAVLPDKTQHLGIRWAGGSRTIGQFCESAHRTFHEFGNRFHWAFEPNRAIGLVDSCDTLMQLDANRTSNVNPANQITLRKDSLSLVRWQQCLIWDHTLIHAHVPQMPDFIRASCRECRALVA